MPGATYSPQMIEKSDSTSLALATIAILGQAPSLSDLETIYCAGTPGHPLPNVRNFSLRRLTMRLKIAKNWTHSPTLLATIA